MAPRAAKGLLRVTIRRVSRQLGDSIQRPSIHRQALMNSRTAEFVDCLSQANLLSELRMRRVRSLAVGGTEANGLARVLIRQGWITQWQAEQVFHGRYQLHLGDFLLRRKLGTGASGAVYEACDLKTRCLVAVKVLAPHLADDPAFVQRFEREVRLLQRLNHPAIVKCYGVREVRGTRFIVMEYLPGHDLAWWLERKQRLPIPVACRIVRQISLAIDYVHLRGMIHRDIKPSNIIVVRRHEEDASRAKLVDFGIARCASDTRDLTVDGAFLGSLAYMAPEQLERAAEVDVRADVFSLGATLLHLISGRSLAEGETVAEKLARRLNTKPTDMLSHARDCPKELLSIIHGCLQTRPRDRFERPRELAEALKPYCVAARGVPASIAPRAASLSTTEEAAEREMTLDAEDMAVPGAVALFGRDSRALRGDMKVLGSDSGVLGSDSGVLGSDSGVLGSDSGVLGSDSAHDLDPFLTSLSATPDHSGQRRRERTSWWLWAAVAVLSFALSLCLAWAALLGGTATVEIPWPREARVREAAVLIDGEPMPVSSEPVLRYRILPGPHYITLRRPGYQRQTRRVTLLPFARTRLSVSWEPDARLAQRQRLARLLEQQGPLLTVPADDPRVADQRRLLQQFAAGGTEPDLVWRVARLLRQLPSPLDRRRVHEPNQGEPDSRVIWTIGSDPLHHSGRVTALCFHPWENQLASAGADGQVRLWELESGQELRPPLRLAGAVRTMAFLPDGQRLLLGGDDGWPALWDLRSGELQRLARPHGNVDSVGVSADGELLVTAGTDNRGRIWRTRDLELLDQLVLGHRGSACAFSSDDQMVAVADVVGGVALWNRRTEESTRLTGGPPTSHLFFEDGDRRLVAVGANRQRVIWNVGRTEKLSSAVDANSTLAVGPRGGWEIHAALGEGGSTLHLRLDGNQRDIGWKQGGPSAAAFDPQRGWLAAGSETGGVVVYRDDLASSRFSPGSADSFWTAVALSRDAGKLAAGSAAGNVVLWDTFSRRQLWSRGVHDGPVEHLAFADEDQRLVSLGAGRIVVQTVDARSATQNFAGQTPIDVSRCGNLLAFRRGDQLVARTLTSADSEFPLADRAEDVTALAVHPLRPAVLLGDRQGRLSCVERGASPVAADVFEGDAIAAVGWVAADRFACVSQSGFFQADQWPSTAGGAGRRRLGFGDAERRWLVPTAGGAVILTGGAPARLAASGELEPLAPYLAPTARVLAADATPSGSHLALADGTGRIVVLALNQAADDEQQGDGDKPSHARQPGDDAPGDSP